jgi:hypothetical protein
MPSVLFVYRQLIRSAISPKRLQKGKGAITASFLLKSGAGTGAISS